MPAQNPIVQFKKKLRKLLSTLFARKMPTLCTRYPEKVGLVEFTDIEETQVYIFQPVASQHVHEVTIQDGDFANELVQYFPEMFLKSSWIDIRQFLVVLNKFEKTKKDELPIILRREDGALMARCEMTDSFGCMKTEDTLIGHQFSEDFEHYWRIIEDYIHAGVPRMTLTEISPGTDPSLHSQYLQISDDKKCKEYRYFIQMISGITTIAWGEYLKQKNNSSRFYCLWEMEKGSTNFVVIYSDDFVRVSSYWINRRIVSTRIPPAEQL